MRQKLATSKDLELALAIQKGLEEFHGTDLSELSDFRDIVMNFEDDPRFEKTVDAWERAKYVYRQSGFQTIRGHGGYGEYEVDVDITELTTKGVEYVKQLLSSNTRMASTIDSIQKRVARLEREASSTKLAEAIQMVKEAKPKDLLDYCIIIMSALEDSNHHTALEKFQKLSGLNWNKLMNMPIEKVGRDISKHLGWDGSACCVAVIASATDMADKRGLMTLVRESGVELSPSLMGDLKMWRGIV